MIARHRGGLEGGSYLALYPDDPVCNEIRVDSDEGNGSGPSATFDLILPGPTSAQRWYDNQIRQAHHYGCVRIAWVGIAGNTDRDR